MFSKKMDRREFLKVVVASAAAAGLSHFRFLNFGGAGTVLADYYGCTDVIPDYCDPQEPGNVDTCPDPSTSSSDVCIPEQGESDECIPMSEADICDPVNPPPDICAPPADPDVCEVPPGGPDTCMTAPDDPDICPDGGAASGGDGDICSVTGQPNPDECIPSVGESDECSPEAGADFCRDPSGVVAYDTCLGELDPDICFENGQNVPDLCTADPYDEDLPPNVTRVTSFRTQPATTLLGAAAALGAAALLHSRKEDKSSA